jgi:hypothetical protein
MKQDETKLKGIFQPRSRGDHMIADLDMQFAAYILIFKLALSSQARGLS